MARENNFLLGHGERLTTPIKVVTGGDIKNPPYDFTTAKKRVGDMLLETVREFVRKTQEYLLSEKFYAKNYRK